IACGKEVAWTYNPAGSTPTGETIVAHYDGTRVVEIAQGTVIPLTLAMGDGHVVWVEDHDSSTGDERWIRSYRGGYTTTLFAIPEPPSQAPAGATFWSGPQGLEVYGNEV